MEDSAGLTASMNQIVPGGFVDILGLAGLAMALAMAPPITS